MLKSIVRPMLATTGVVIILSLSPYFLDTHRASAQEKLLQAANNQSGSSSRASASPASYERLVTRYCVTCHNEELNTGNLRLDNLDLSNVAEDAQIWEKVVHKLRVNEMPPSDKPQLSTGAHESLLSWLITTLDQGAAINPDPGRPAVHRLNRSEYANAVRDFLGLEVDTKSLLPSDTADYGFDNIADSLKFSPMLLERYMMAASKISHLAVGDPDQRPRSKIYTLPKALLQEDRMSEELSFGSRGGLSVRHHFPLDGEYVIKVNVESPRSDQPQDLFQRSDAPEQLDIRVDGARVGIFNIGKPKSTEWSYRKNDFGGGAPADKADLADWWGARTLEARFTAKAGTRSVGVSFLKRTLAYEGTRPKAFPAFYDYLGLLRGVEPGVIDFEIAGPFDATGVGDESESRNKIFTRYPTGADDETETAEEILSNLAHRAYRRPITEADMDTLMAFYDQGRSDGGFEDGIQLALERILVSPSFLFRVETDPLEQEKGSAYYLNDLELASRLSFFLWSSIPDDELLEVAERGELKDPEVLENQVRRMLADDRAESLTTNFATQWLYLRNVDAVTPDVNLFPDFDDNLRRAMRRETELFFESQLRDDASVSELLSANYTFLNERLAKHYDIPGIYGSHFRRVELDDPNRGGLLGQASILTVTSYATRTSPVKRGKWILENILGSPPPPPPGGVPPLPEKSEQTEAMTIRQMFEKHREDPGCASCHVKMDPIGFALENFDAIGKWRTRTRDNLFLDSTGTLPDGTHLTGSADLRKALAENEGFTMTAIQKLLIYAVGRGVDYYDQPAIREIAREASTDDYSWSSVILGIVKSTPFQMRRAS